MTPTPQSNLQLQSLTTPNTFHIYNALGPLLIEPTATEPNYTKYVSHIEECPWPPTNRAQVHSILLHQDSMAYSEI